MSDSPGDQLPTTYSFRQRFELTQGGRLPFKEKTLVLHEVGTATIELRSMEDKPLDESVRISVWGETFATKEEAEVAGALWRGVVQRALAGVNLGANFGLRNPNMGGFTDEFLAKIKEDTGVTVYRDSWDLLVFPSEPVPRFSSGSAEGYVTSPPPVVRASIGASMGIEEPPNEIAFDLFSASRRGSHMADVRLVLLVMAIECLVERVERPATTREHIEKLVADTENNASLEPDERESLANALRGLRYQSTRKAVKSLAKTLNPSAYSEEPSRLLLEAFDMRNALVHGRRRPDLERVRQVGATLERMVSDLIAGPLVAAAAFEARQALT